VSVEAISWALNLAPLPADRGGQPSSACKFVLVSLANHAGPDGTGAFPSAGPPRRVRPVASMVVAVQKRSVASPFGPAGSRDLPQWRLNGLRWVGPTWPAGGLPVGRADVAGCYFERSSRSVSQSRVCTASMTAASMAAPARATKAPAMKVLTSSLV
jgi:hypothetical protein